MNIYSFKDYLHLFNYFFYGTNPVIFVAGIIGLCFYFKKFFKLALIRFLIILLIFDVTLKIFKFYSTGILTERYLLFSIFIINVFSLAGFFKISHLLIRIFKFLKPKLPSYINRKNIFILMIITTICIMLGKTFNPRFDKPWLKDINLQIKKINSSQSSSVIITNGDDLRIGYYAGIKMLKLNLKNLSIADNIDYKNKINNKYYMRNGVDNFYKNLEELRYQDVFLFIDKMSQNKFKNMFIKQNIPFKFKILKEYHDNRNKTYCLYIFDKYNSSAWFK